MAVQDYELLLRVRADLMEAINGLKGLTDQLGGADAATRKLGESENQATDRIRTMVQASLDQQRAVQQSATATRDAAVQNERIVAAYDQQAAAAVRAAAATADYNRSFQQAGAGNGAAVAKTAALAAQREEMAKLAGQIDPTINALKRLDEQEKSLNAMRKAGVVGMEDYARFKAVIDANRLAITGAGQAMHTFSLNTAQTRLELGRLIKDISTGQWGRLASTGTTLANQAGFISALFSPIGLAIGGIVGSLGLFAVAAIKAQDDAAKFNQAIIQTGNYAGVTSGQLTLMATQMRAPFNQAENTLQLLVQSGKVTHDRLQEAGQAAIDLATVTGENIKKTVAEFVKLQDDPVRAAKALDDSLHVLTLTQYENIKALAEQGDADSAAAIAQTAFANALRARAVDVQKSTGLMAKAWDNLKSHVMATWNAMMKVGAPTTNAEDVVSIDQQLDAYRKRVAEIRARSGNTAPITDAELANAPEIALSQDKIKALLAQKQTAESGALFEKWVSDTESQNTRINTEAKKASDTMDKYLQAAKSDKVKAAEIAEVKKATAKLIADNPAFKDKYLADEKTAIAGIEKKFKAPRAPRQKSDAAAIAAQQQLVKLLNDEQGALDPVAKAWAEYNNKVAEANRLAEKAKTARGADKQAIDAERDALIANAAAVRDAAIEKQVDADRKAWEKLRDSLRTPVEVATDKAVEKLVELNKLMQRLKGTKDEISGAQYADAVKRIADQSVTAAPKYKGLDASVGGVFSELGKNLRAQAKLDDWHQQQLAQNEAFRAKDAGNEEAYQERLKAIDDKYAKQRAIIEQSRGQLILQTSSNLFGQLAQLSRSHNTKMAIIGKTAAIAQAIINTYQSATASYSAMASIPYVGPALGAAAAAVAIATGLANVAQIRAQPVGGYAEGGYTGAGGKFEVAGVVHKGEGVLSQQDIAALGGPDGFYALQHQLRNGYADGGIAWPTPELPPVGSLSDVMATADAAARNRPGADSAGAPGQTHIHVWSIEAAAEELAKVPAFQDAVVHVVGDNPRTIQGKWGR